MKYSKLTLFLFTILLSLFGYNTKALASQRVSLEQDSCVDINFKNGKTVFAKIVKGNGRIVSYQKCNSEDKKIYTIYTDNIASIVKSDAKSQLEAYGIGKNSTQRKITNALLWAGFLNLFGFLLIPTGGLLFIASFLLAFLASIIGIKRLTKFTKYPLWGWALAFLIFCLIISILYSIVPLILVFLF